MELKTIEDLQTKLTDLQKFYSQRNSNMLAWRDLYFMQPEAIWQDEDGLYVEPEIDEERIMLPIAMNTVEGFRELLLTKAPAISVPAPTVKGTDLINAEHNERALLATWDRAQIYERLRDSLWHGLVDGWGVLQVLWDKDAGEDESPVVVLHHDPFNVYPMPGDVPDTWKYVIHAYPRLVGQIQEDWYPDKGDGRARKVRVAREAFEGLADTDQATFVDYWDDKVNAVAMEVPTKNRYTGDLQMTLRWLKEPTPHNYGFLPWEIFLPCRLPFRTVGERTGVSVLYVIEGLIAYMDRLISEKATMLRRWQDPPLVTETELGPDFEPVRTERGMHLRLRTGERAAYLTHPGPMPQIDTLAAQISENIETSALPRVLQGLYVGSVSGIAMSLLRNPTLMKVAFKQREIERACERLNSKILKLFERKLTKPIYLWGSNQQGVGVDVMVDPSKIVGYYRNEVKLSASLPTDDASTVNMLATLVQLRVMSRQTARDVAQQTLHDMVPQSLIDEEERILAEMIWNDPGMIQAMARAAAEGVSLPYLSKPENPRGGVGEREVTMPAGTLPTQTPGMPGGNTEPNIQQRLAEMVQGATPTGSVRRPPEGIM